MVPVPSITARTEDSQVPESEDLHVRNYDDSNEYDLHLRVSDGETVYLDDRYVLMPGGAGSSINLLPTGTYTVEATLDGRHEAVAEVTVDDDPAHTIHVEIGNGLVAVSEGVR